MNNPPINQELLQKALKIKCLISDVDGVLTNGELIIDNHGNELKKFNALDGMGLKLLMCADIHVAVITTSRNAVIDHRMEQLGIRHYFKGQVEKLSAFKTLKETLSLNDEECAYIGDDLPDLPLIQRVGLGIAVANAVSLVKHHADWVTEKEGGFGAVREVCDLLLQVKQCQNLALERYLAS